MRDQHLLVHQETIHTLRENLEKQKATLQNQQQELLAKEKKNQTQYETLQAAQHTSAVQKHQLHAHQERIQALQQHVETHATTLRKQQQELCAKEKEIQTQHEELRNARNDLTGKEDVLQNQQHALIEKDDMMTSQYQELVAKEDVIQSLLTFRNTSWRYWDVHYLRPFAQRILPAFFYGALRRIRRSFLTNLGTFHQYEPVSLKIPSRYYTTSISTQEPVPTVSIVTPSFNQAQFLERTLKSVLEQEYPQIEYIVQDGASHDGTPRLLERYRPRLAYMESCQDNGQADAINRGFHHSSGEIMAYLNSDDLFLPGTVAYVMKFFLDHSDVDVVYGHRIIVNDNDLEIGRWVLPQHDDNMLQWADYVPQETLFWRRRIWEKAGGYLDESFHFALDWDLLLRFRDAGATFSRLPRFLAVFRVHELQKTSHALENRGFQEMHRLRTRLHGRHVTHAEAQRRISGYLRRQVMYAWRHRLGLLRH